MDASQVHQAILARDIINMARDNTTNPAIIEYIESLCWELFMIFREQPQKIIDWDKLSAAYEQQYMKLQKGGKPIEQLAEVDAIYSKALQTIENHHPKDKSRLI